MHLLTLLLVLMFALVIAYFCYCVYFYGGRWVADPSKCLFFTSPRPRDPTRTPIPSFSLKKKKKSHEDSML